MSRLTDLSSPDQATSAESVSPSFHPFQHQRLFVTASSHFFQREIHQKKQFFGGVGLHFARERDESINHLFL
jgi:hypothetical protein